ncbi:Teneurin-3 [Aphelenchoides besseyi]|nr:Teneurin-3 [Aphelenchoides besseyi]
MDLIQYQQDPCPILSARTRTPVDDLMLPRRIPQPPNIPVPKVPSQVNLYEVARPLTPCDTIVIEPSTNSIVRTANSYGTLWTGATAHRLNDTRCNTRCTSSIVPDRRSLIRSSNEIPMHAHHEPSAFLMGHSSSSGSQDDARCFAGPWSYRTQPPTSKYPKQETRSRLFNEKTARVYFVLSVIFLFISFFLFLFKGNLSYVYSDYDLISSFEPTFSIKLGSLTKTELPPRRLVYSDLTLQHDTNVTLLFNISDPNARFVVFAQKTLPPSFTSYDFRRVVTAEHIHSRTKRDSVIDEYKQAVDEVPIRNGLVAFEASSGHWFIGVFNDAKTPLSLSISAFNLKAESEDQVDGCPFDCFGKGTCSDNRCLCYAGYDGKFCQETTCPIYCSGNGIFANGHCNCHRGWKGSTCAERAVCLVPNCNGHGSCDQLQGMCTCDRGWSGESCDTPDCLDPTCSDHGICRLGKCYCRNGYSGSSCEKAIHSANFEALHANQTMLEATKADNVLESVTAPIFEDVDTDANCNYKGTFDNSTKRCVCVNDYDGEFCDQLKCNPECINGQCVHGRCFCNEKYSGLTCDRQDCPDDCNGNGSCFNGTCLCKIGYNGESCDELGCKNNCNNGDCQLVGQEYKCFCKSSFFGSACEFALESICDDKIDNDDDGLTDCEDSECCSHSSCKDHQNCMTGPELKVPTRTNSRPMLRFNDRVKFLLGINSAQIYADPEVFDERRVSVIRGQIFSQKGGPLTGVRISDTKNRAGGFTLSRAENGGGSFNFVVNGGGFVRLSLLRHPYGTIEKTFFVPPNEIVDVGRIFIDKSDIPTAFNSSLLDLSIKPSEACRSAHLNHNYALKVVPNWRLHFDGYDVKKSVVHLSPISRTSEIHLPIDGTDGMELVYNSDRAEATSSLVFVRMLGKSVSMRRVHLKIAVAGRVFERIFKARPHLQFTFDWDRKDVYDQVVSGLTDVELRVGYEYDECNELAEDGLVWQIHQTQLEGHSRSLNSFGLFALNVQHNYHPVHNILERGNGRRRLLDDEPIVRTVVGNQQRRPVQCPDCRSTPISNAPLYAPFTVVSMSDRSLIVGDYNLIRRLSPDGNQLDLLLELPIDAVGRAYHLAVDSATNNVYLSLPQRHQVWRLRKLEKIKEPKNNYLVIAGSGAKCETATDCSSGDNSALLAKFGDLRGLSFDRNSGFYLIDGLSIRHINAEGKLSNLVTANNWRWKEDCPNAFRLELLNLEQPLSLLVEPHTQDLIVLDTRAVYRIDVRLSIVRLLAGEMYNCDRRVTPSNSLLHHPQAIALNSRTGRLYIAESDAKQLHQVRSVSINDGPLTPVAQVAGRMGICICEKTSCPCDDPIGETKVAANEALFHSPTSLAVDIQSGSIYVADQDNYKLKIIENTRPKYDKHRGTYTIESTVDNQVFMFDSDGRHLTTKNLSTGQPLHKFSYSIDGKRLVNVQMPTSINLTISTVDSDIILETSTGHQTSLSTTSEDGYSQINGFSTSSTETHWTFGYDGQLINELVGFVERFQFFYDSTGHITTLIGDSSNQTTSTTTPQFDENGSLLLKFTDNGKEILLSSLRDNEFKLSGND